MEVQLNSALEKQVWLTDYFKEYVRESGYMPYMGKSNNSVIIVKRELQDDKGKTINIPLITRLKGTGVSGSQILVGNEEDIGNYNCALSVDWRRHAVRVPKSTSYKTEIDLFAAGKDLLRSWEAERLRDDFTNAGLSIIPLTTTVTPTAMATITEDTTNGGYQITAADWAAGASESDRDKWLVLNKDRVVFGALASNYSSGDHSVALATLDTTADKLTAAELSFAKRRAKAASPHIRPYKNGANGREYFLMLCGPRSFRDLKADLKQLNLDGRPRDPGSNPVFQDGDVEYDGVIAHEVPEIPHIVNVGSGGTTDVEANYLCGAQAFGIAWGQEPTMRPDMTFDFSFRPGVAIEELLKVSKLHFNGVQQGIVTTYVAAAADA